MVKNIPQQDLLGVKWNTDLGKPQFHVPVQKQHHDFIVPVQRKSYIKALFKYISVNIKWVVVA